MKKNSLVVAVFFALWVTGCDQKKPETETTETEEVATAATPVVNNPNTTNPQEIATSADAPVLTFKETTHDFGTIKDGEVVKHSFEFTNTGKSPLVIESATSTCGCTVPEPPKDPILPGQSSKIEVQFSSAGKGGTQQMKTVMIKANTQPDITQINIKANVAAADGTMGPRAN